MSNPLQIIDVSPVTLIASLDASGSLQLAYGAVELEDYGDAIEVINDNLPVTIQLPDFVHGGNTWQMSARHFVAPNTISWTRNSSSCSYAWSATGGQVEVEVEATSGSQSPTKPILIKVRPRTEQ